MSNLTLEEKVKIIMSQPKLTKKEKLLRDTDVIGKPALVTENLVALSNLHLSESIINQMKTFESLSSEELLNSVRKSGIGNYQYLDDLNFRYTKKVKQHLENDALIIYYARYIILNKK